MGKAPSTNGHSGGSDRDKGGRFLPGWRGGPGDPLGGRRARFIAAWIDLVEPEDVQRVYEAVLKAALAGNVDAMRLFLDRTLGRVADTPKAEQRGGTSVEELQRMTEDARIAIRNELVEQVNRHMQEAAENPGDKRQPYPGLN